MGNKKSKFDRRRQTGYDDVDAAKASNARIPNRVRIAQQENRTQTNYYPVNGNGFLLIINFSKDREGSQEDCKALRRFFGGVLNYQVEEMYDYNKDTLIKELDDLQKKLNRKHVCFVCVVMAHGNEDGFMTNDLPIPYSEVIQKFDNTRMVQMAGKPKFFIINTCRVEKNGRDTNDTDCADEWELNQQEYVYEHSDIAVYYSTVSGYVSWRNGKTGSTFIQKIVEVFEEKYKDQDINDMVKQINCAVQATSRQVPTLEDRLTKKLFFASY